MKSNGPTTVPAVSTETSYDGRASDEREVPALTVVMNLVEPDRAGEVAPFDHDGIHVLGRDGDDSSTVVFFQIRAGDRLGCGPLLGNALSRKQATFDVRGDEIVVENTGQLDMRVNGIDVKGKRRLAENDVIEILKHSSYLFSMRRTTPRAPIGYPAFGFGLADPFGIVGESDAVWALREALVFAAALGDHVLVHGESGTGKDLAARAIHALSMRSRGPLIECNVASIAPTLVSAAIFGNLKNYPNPGMAENEGFIGAAAGGTLFLDEVGEVADDVLGAIPASPKRRRSR
jgi:two-component system nitrogen regulation response regulator GlnG/two-component system response regulator HydG